MTWANNAVSVYCVLGLGSFLGATTKGITGFGSAIIHLCIWVTFKSAGIQSGTLQQAVLVESLCSTALAGPLIYVTRAWQTADVKLLVSVSVFVTLGSPVGAKMLSSMDVRHVELVIAGLLAVMLLLSTGLPGLLVRCIRGCCGCCCRRKAAGSTESSKDVDAIGGSVVAGDMVVVDVALSDESDQVQHEQPDVQHQQQHQQHQQHGQSLLQEHLQQLPQHSVKREHAAWNDAAHSDDSSDVTQPLLDSSSDFENHEADGLPLLSEHGGVPPQPGSRREMWAWLRVFGLASVAGTLSGIMEGLTGMNGPPIILLYQYMGTQKACVRGTNAFLNLLQFRIIAYIYVGMMSWGDVELYCVCMAAGLGGVLFGNALAALMQQEVFQNVMRFLMVLCAVLMFASGMGLVQ